MLREVRREIAVKEKVPAYIIFHDAALKEMASEKPTTQLAQRLPRLRLQKDIAIKKLFLLKMTKKRHEAAFSCAQTIFGRIIVPNTTCPEVAQRFSYDIAIQK